MKYLLSLLFVSALLGACSTHTLPQKDRAIFEASKITHRFISVADMNDAFFELRENNFFEFYRQLFDSVKNSSYPGKYQLKGDTLVLSFYNPKGKTLLGSRALIGPGNNEIVFFK